MTTIARSDYTEGNFYWFVLVSRILRKSALSANRAGIAEQIASQKTTQLTAWVTSTYKMTVYQDFDEMLNPFFFYLISDKRVCGDCLNDSGLKKFLAHKVPPNKQKCSYCRQSAKTVDVDDLQQYILQFFPYGNADEELPSDYLREDEGGIRKEVKGEGDAAEYVPTQAICRYFKTQGAAEILNINLSNPELPPELQLLKETSKIDGFCYRSSKGTERTCYVLFYGNEESAEILELVPHPARKTFHPSPSLPESLNAMLNAVEK